MVFYRLRAVQRWNPIAISLLRKRLTHYNSFDVVGQSVLPSEASVRAINPAEPTSRDRVSDDASAWDPRPGLGHQLLLAIWWCVGFYALTGCSSREFVERSYVNVDDVTRQNAFSPAGKVPVRLPPSSIDIRIRSSVQTDDVWAVFSWVCSRFPMGRGVAIIGTELRILRQSSEVSVCAGLDPLERSGQAERTGGAREARKRVSGCFNYEKRMLLKHSNSGTS